jgi:hypothetical protein
MAEVTYYVALPFAASDDGVAACEPTECFNPIAALYVGYVSPGGAAMSTPAGTIALI